MFKNPISELSNRQIFFAELVGGFCLSHFFISATGPLVPPGMIIQLKGESLKGFVENHPLILGTCENLRTLHFGS